jgi:hypothetical protein
VTESSEGLVPPEKVAEQPELMAIAPPANAKLGPSPNRLITPE